MTRQKNYSKIKLTEWIRGVYSVILIELNKLVSNIEFSNFDLYIVFSEFENVILIDIVPMLFFNPRGGRRVFYYDYS